MSYIYIYIYEISSLRVNYTAVGVMITSQVGRQNVVFFKPQKLICLETSEYTTSNFTQESYLKTRPLQYTSLCCLTSYNVNDL